MYFSLKEVSRPNIGRPEEKKGKSLGTLSPFGIRPRGYEILRDEHRYIVTLRQSYLR